MVALKKRKLAIIDLGTNSIRFDVHSVSPKGKTELLHRERLMVRLGDGVFLTGKLDRAAKSRALLALQRFRRIADDLEVEATVAFGTSTLREVSDSDDFLRKIAATTGFKVRIISGEEEAKLIALGILANRPDLKSGKVAFVDIGGGSTEISICRDREILHCVSFPLGAARLQQLFLKDLPSRAGAGEAVERLRRQVRSALRSKMIAEDWPRVPKIIGSSGTVRALSRISRKAGKGRVIRSAFLKSLVERMIRMRPAEIRRIPGVEPKRADILLAGAVLLDEAMDALGASETHITRYALRDGILLQQIRSLPRQGGVSELDLFPLYAKACRLGCQEGDLKRLVATAELLYDALSPLHRLGARWRDYLRIAVVFRDVGWAISPIRHELHSSYIVRHAELPLTAAWERELIADLCLYHENGKIKYPSGPFKGESKRVVRRAFGVLMALLRVVDALDPAHQAKVNAQKVVIDRSAIHLVLSSGPAAELAKLRIQQKQALFRRVFGRDLVAEPARAALHS